MCPKSSFKFRVSSFEFCETARGRSRSVVNSQLATRNWKLRERGFSIVTAIFLVVVLALLGAFIVSVTGLQQTSTQLDVQGVRAYQAARAGVGGLVGEAAGTAGQADRRADARGQGRR